MGHSGFNNRRNVHALTGEIASNGLSLTATLIYSGLISRVQMRKSPETGVSVCEGIGIMIVI